MTDEYNARRHASAAALSAIELAIAAQENGADEVREKWRAELVPYLTASADGSMSRNNSMNLAAELLDWIKKN